MAHLVNDAILARDTGGFPSYSEFNWKHLKTNHNISLDQTKLKLLT